MSVNFGTNETFDHAFDSARNRIWYFLQSRSKPVLRVYEHAVWPTLVGILLCFVKMTMFEFLSVCVHLPRSRLKILGCDQTSIFPIKVFFIKFNDFLLVFFFMIIIIIIQYVLKVLNSKFFQIFHKLFQYLFYTNQNINHC